MYEQLDTKKTNLLYLKRKGWLSPQYDLSDNAFEYGRLEYKAFFRSEARAYTASCSWVFRSEGFSGRSFAIINQNGETIGNAKREWLARKTVLMLQTGFSAEFYRTSLWSHEYRWSSAGYGQIMRIETYFSGHQDTIYLENTNTPESIIPLLILLGEHLIILRRRQTAAH